MYSLGRQTREWIKIASCLVRNLGCIRAPTFRHPIVSFPSLPPQVILLFSTSQYVCPRRILPCFVILTRNCHLQVPPFSIPRRHWHVHCHRPQLCIHFQRCSRGLQT